MTNTQNVKNTTFDASQLGVEIEGVFMREKRFLLTPLQHRILSDDKSNSKEWSRRFLLISIGISVTILSKATVFIYECFKADNTELNEINSNIQTWELVYLGLGLFLSFILWVISRTKFGKSEKNDLLKNIKNYFDGK